MEGIVPDYRKEDAPDYKEEDVPDYIPDKKYSQRERYPTKEMEDGEILMRVSEVIMIRQLVILSCQTNLYKLKVVDRS